MRSTWCCWAFSLALTGACGSASKPASAPAEGQEDAQCPDPNKPCGGPMPGHEDAEQAQAEPGAAESADAKPAEPKAAEATAPAFKENGSVLEAINAVPQGTPRLNIEQEALGQPLGNVSLYESCKPGNAHFKAKVAVWDGKAVGLDLTTTPKNPKFAACIADKIRGITWPDHVKSLNIVEYTF
jgi:hypothetical protein